MSHVTRCASGVKKLESILHVSGVSVRGFMQCLCWKLFEPGIVFGALFSFTSPFSR